MTAFYVGSKVPTARNFKTRNRTKIEIITMSDYYIQVWIRNWGYLYNFTCAGIKSPI